MSGLVLMFNITDSCWNKTSNQTTYVLHFICKDVMRLIKAITKTTMYIQTIPVLEKREWHWHMAHNSEQASVTFLKCSSTEWVLFNRTARISSCDYENTSHTKAFPSVRKRVNWLLFVQSKLHQIKREIDFLRAADCNGSLCDTAWAFHLIHRII